jgi:hypothetical protein
MLKSHSQSQFENIFNFQILLNQLIGSYICGNHHQTADLLKIWLGDFYAKKSRTCCEDKKEKTEHARSSFVLVSCFSGEVLFNFDRSFLFSVNVCHLITRRKRSNIMVL